MRWSEEVVVDIDIKMMAGWEVEKALLIVYKSILNDSSHFYTLSVSTYRGTKKKEREESR